MVSFTTSPVTQIDVVAENRASGKEVQFPSAEDIGSAKRRVPIKIEIRKLSGIKQTDLSLILFGINIITCLSYKRMNELLMKIQCNKPTAIITQVLIMYAFVGFIKTGFQGF